MIQDLVGGMTISQDDHTPSWVSHPLSHHHQHTVIQMTFEASTSDNIGYTNCAGICKGVITTDIMFVDASGLDMDET